MQLVQVLNNEKSKYKSIKLDSMCCFRGMETFFYSSKRERMVHGLHIIFDLYIYHDQTFAVQKYTQYMYLVS
jgi:hypothetical protein